MGAGNSKPAEGTEYVLKQSGPPTAFSHDFLESLQNTGESDSTRAKTLQLHIQSRVEKELQKAHTEELKRIQDLSEKLSREVEQTGSVSDKTRAELQNASDSIDSADGTNQLSLFDRVAGAFESSDSAEAKRRQSLSRDTVLAQINGLQTKLSERRKVESVDPAIKKAQADVMNCLRLNDRKPLNCWEEVEKFKTEVGRIEQKALAKALG